MVEDEVRISTRDGASLYGRLRRVDGGRRIALIVHGVTGHMNEHLHYNAARAFEAAGWSTLRFNLYGFESDTRQLRNCSLAQHARDLDDALRFVRATVDPRTLAVIGHSLGGMTALEATEPCNGLALWDASHSAHLFFLRDVESVPELGLYRSRGAVDVLLPPTLVDEVRALNSDAVARRHKESALIVGCSDGLRAERARRYAEHWGGPSQLVVIPDSDHCFTREGNLEALYGATLEWLERLGNRSLTEDLPADR